MATPDRPWSQDQRAAPDPQPAQARARGSACARMPAHVSQRGPLLRVQVSETPQHRRFRDPRRPDHRREPPIASRACLSRRPQPPGPLIQHPLRVQQPVPLTDRALIDHNPQFYITRPAPSQTKSGVLSPAAPQALRPRYRRPRSTGSDHHPPEPFLRTDHPVHNCQQPGPDGPENTGLPPSSPTSSR